MIVTLMRALLCKKLFLTLIILLFILNKDLKKKTITKTDVLVIYVECIPISFVIVITLVIYVNLLKLKAKKIYHFVENVHRPRKNLLSDDDDEIHMAKILKCCQ